jgi:prepilin peptidase CpaA
MHVSLWGFLVGALALAVAVWGGWLDWRARRIPNWLTVPALLLGLATNTLAWGWPGAKAALEGTGLGLGLLLPLVLVRGLGAGDWKMMGALGAFLGPARLLVVLTGTVFIAGAMAVVEMVRRKRVNQTLANLWTLILIVLTFGHRSARENISLDNPGLLALPFGVAAALSTVLFFCLVVAFRFSRP